MNSSANQEAWLFTLAEEKLTTFAQRIDQELPDLNVLIKSNSLSKEYGSGYLNKSSKTTQQKNAANITLLGGTSESTEGLSSTQNSCENTTFAFEQFGGFRERLIEAFG